MITAEDVREFFEYSFTDGHLYWRKSKGTIKQGSQAGTQHKRGYRVIMFKRKSYLEHRLVWLWRYGVWPPDECIDHIDGNTSNNCLNNIRAVTLTINQINRWERHRYETKTRSKQAMQKQDQSSKGS